MAKSLSAKKRIRQNVKQQARNKAAKTSIKTAQKKVLAAVEQGDHQGAVDSCKAAVKALDRAASKGLIHRRAVARRKSKLTKKVNALAQTEAPATEAGAEKASESE